MEKGLKYGLLAAAAGLGIYSIWKANQEEEVAALPSVATLEPVLATLEPVLSYSEWRDITQNGGMEYWNLPAPEEIPGKTLVNLAIEAAKPSNMFGAVPYYMSGNYGMFLATDYPPIKNSFRVVAIYI